MIGPVVLFISVVFIHSFNTVLWVTDKRDIWTVKTEHLAIYVCGKNLCQLFLRVLFWNSWKKKPDN